MDFEVLWSADAVDSIQRVYDTAGDKRLISEAIQLLDSELKVAPGTKGESRAGGHRIVFSPPLAAVIEIQWRLNTVIIGEIWRFERHSQK